MVLLIFILGMLLGVLAGGTLCVQYLRAEIAANIGPELRRMHDDLDQHARRLQNQLDNVESAVNLAMATWYAELSSHQPRPTAIPAPRAADESNARRSSAGAE